MKKILVVDDSEVIVEVVKKTLQMYGYEEIVSASNGVEALEVAKK